MSEPAHFSTPPTPSEVDTARRLRSSVDDFRQFKSKLGDAARQLEEGADPADIRTEEAEYQKMHVRAGWFKRQNTAPNILVMAAKTPGRVAQMVLMVICYA